MSIRVQVILDEAERDELRRLARAEGLSLSAWFREAGRERARAAREQARFPTESALDEFFAAWDRMGDGPDREPDWEEHLRVIDRSRGHGQA